MFYVNQMDTLCLWVCWHIFSSYNLTKLTKARINERILIMQICIHQNSKYVWLHIAKAWTINPLFGAVVLEQ